MWLKDLAQKMHVDDLAALLIKAVGGRDEAVKLIEKAAAKLAERAIPEEQKEVLK